jgi:hypothetical protein
MILQPLLNLAALGNPNACRNPRPRVSEPKARTHTPHNYAATLHKNADALQKKIDHLLNPPISKQRPTPRRARIAEGMIQEGERLQRAQTILRYLADEWDAQTIPNSVKHIRNAEHIAEVMRRHEDDDARTHLMAIIGPARTTASKLREAQAAILRMNIDGYFPTPESVINRMIDLIKITPTTILEPSAGSGHIAQVLRQEFPFSVLDCIEIDHDLRKILTLKGFNLLGYNFLNHTAPADLIVMNPPFEYGQDRKHIQYAYTLLNPGGQLVSVACESSFFREDKQSCAFRDWLNEVGAKVIENPQGAFLQSERPTGVNTRIISIVKH